MGLADTACQDWSGGGDRPVRPVEFWIDVGGTFTDCIARWPDGTVRTYKLLSSGAYRGRTEAGSTRSRIVDTARTQDPDGFFVGFRFRLLRGSGGEERVVREFNRGRGELVLDEPLSEPPPDGTAYELVSDQEAPALGVRWLLGKGLQDPTGPIRVKLGTTRGTNALLERNGARTALVTTRGLGDALFIGYQNRPELFSVRVRRPMPLYERVVEVDERIDRDGQVLIPLDERGLRQSFQQLRDEGFEAVAICLVNAYRNPCHEQRAASIAAEYGFRPVSVSTDLAALPKYVPRGDTTVVDAYLTPVIDDYLARLQEELPEAELLVMTSAGALRSAAAVRGRDVILSGPAGGVVGAAFVGQRAGFQKIIGFDMGGTSTDVSRFDGQFERRYEMEVLDPDCQTGVRVVAPMLAIETVAAGGGSICWFDGVKPVVGPRSAGADPGPACYGKGGPLCITDVNLYLGRLVAEFFPFPLDYDAVERRLDELIAAVREASGVEYSREQLAEGFIRIANQNMASAIKRISIARGYDTREYVLVSFGGAGAQHACSIARNLGIRRVLCSPYAGVLSALGIGTADITRFSERTVLRPYTELTGGEGRRPIELDAIFAELEESATRQLLDEGVEESWLQKPKRFLEMRFRLQESTIHVPEPPDGDYEREFRRLHRQLYGFEYADRPVEVYAARVERTAELPKPELPVRAPTSEVPHPRHWTRSYFNGQWMQTPVYLRRDLHPGHCFEGPAIVIEPASTVVVEPGWKATVGETDDIVLEDISGGQSGVVTAADELERPDPVRLELFQNHFMSIAEQAGATLQKIALSTNVKERLDFSCALFTPSGDLVANAPHIPVHLGAMSECVKCFLADVREFEPGDVFVTNDPFRGGSHLPDITVITPVFLESSGERKLAFFAASRAHHAEIGGMTPGSMPPFSRRLVEEGVVIRWFRAVHRGSFDEEGLRRLLSSGPYPSRRPDENVADIQAQIAANQVVVNLLRELVDRYGLSYVHAYMRHVQEAASRAMRRALERFHDGVYSFEDAMDDGTPIKVRIEVFRDPIGRPSLILDFTGSGPVHPGNLNANRAIVTSAVLYCLRCLIPDPIPLNAGVLDPVEIRIPRGTILDPSGENVPIEELPAVVGGNVETSQRVVDVIFGALGVVAASQGTMNNFIFGTPEGAAERLSYYETIGGGAGAGPGFHGADAIHTHMTNTRITDVEVLELRYPVLLRQFAVRRGSGGKGKFRGGNGIIREVEFLVPMEVSLLTSRRTRAPYGLEGGLPAQRGRNLLRRADSTTWEELASQSHVIVGPGDRIRIETPGGGGWGTPDRHDGASD